MIFANPEICLDLPERNNDLCTHVPSGWLFRCSRPI